MTCPVVSLELVWPWQLVSLTFREDNLKQAPAGPLLAFLTLYKLPKTKPFLHLSLASAGAKDCLSVALSCRAMPAHPALVPEETLEAGWWWWWGSGRDIAAWPLGWGDPGEPPQPFGAKLQWPRILRQSPTPSSLLTPFTEKNEGHLPQTLQGPNFLQATREMLRTFQKAWGPWGLEARPAQGVGGGRGCSYFSSHSQGPLLGPWCPGRGPQCRTLWEALAGARRCRQAGVNGTLLLSACPGSHSPRREQPGDLRGGYRCFGRLSRGQGPPPGLQLSPRKASVGLARRRPDLSVAPQGGRASELVPAYAEAPDVDNCPHARPHETTDALTGNKGQGCSVCLKALYPACPIDAQGCPAPVPPPVAGLPPGRSQ